MSIVNELSNQAETKVNPTPPKIIRQPLAYLLVRLIGVGLAILLATWVLHASWSFLVNHFPFILPELEPGPFWRSPLFFWSIIIYLGLVIGIFIWWRSIFIQISPDQVVMHSGIIIKQAKVLKRLGINIRSIQLSRTPLSTLLNYLTVEIGSEIMGGITMVIADDQATILTINEALKPGEVNEVKKFF